MTLLLCVLLAHAEPDSLNGVLSPSDVPADAIPTLSPSAPPNTAQAADRELSATTTLGEPVIVGATDRNAYDQVIASESARIAACVEGVPPDTFTVKAVVLPDGGVRTATSGDSAPEVCLAGVFQGLRFPAAAGVVVLTYPFLVTSP